MTDRLAEQWWICTDVLARGGVKVLGPFATQELALDVRFYVEKVSQFHRVGAAPSKRRSGSTPRR